MSVERTKAIRAEKNGWNHELSVCVCAYVRVHFWGTGRAGRLLKGTKTIPVDVYLAGKCSWLLPLFSWNPMNEVSAELH